MPISKRKKPVQPPKRTPTFKLARPLTALPLKPARKRMPKTREVELRLRHSINGVSYGPGTLTVPFDVAEVLVEQEQRAAAEEARCFAQESVPHIIVGEPGKRRAIRGVGGGSAVDLTGVGSERYAIATINNQGDIAR